MACTMERILLSLCSGQLTDKLFSVTYTYCLKMLFASDKNDFLHTLGKQATDSIYKSLFQIIFFLIKDF